LKLLKIIILIFCFQAVRLQLSAQKTTSSPYSSYGLGDIESKGLAVSAALGDSKYSLFLPNNITIANPASYSWLETPTFEAGVASNFLSLTSSASAKQSGNSTYFRNMAIGIPTKTFWAFTLGVVPYSKMGYDISTSDTISGFGQVNYSYEGAGGMSQGFFGNSFKLINDSANQFSVGINCSYLFGSLQKTSRVIPEGSLFAYNTRARTNTNASGIYLDAGILYRRKIFKKSYATAGFVYSPQQNLSSNIIYIAESYTGSSPLELVKDTVAFDTIGNKISIPQMLGGGLTFEINQKLNLSLEYSLQDWSSFEMLGKKQGLAKREQISLGIQYVYHTNKMLQDNLLKVIRYRAGFRYVNSYLSVNGEQLSEYGISFGLGIPMIQSRTKTTFNLSAEAGKRGNTGNGLIKENFIRLMFGFSFTPGDWDEWFKVNKID
jgi:hypothetical protein